MAVEGIIFDHDGTLVDSEYIHFTIWQRLLEEFSISFTQDEYLTHYIGVPTLQAARHIIDTYSLDLSAEKLYEKNFSLTMKTLGNEPAPLMPGVEQVLDHCRAAGVRIAIASGASRSEIFTSILGHTCLNNINLVSCREDVPRNKPAPDVYLLALSKLALNSTQCVAIEDSQNGVKSAVAAGLHCIAVPNEFSHSQDFRQAHFVADNLLHAWEYLQTL
ncbi:Fructose-1-phosphate phosphatase YqaB [Thalassocella blandensis]|nr:Fructose-1-phosphate phosphatase YqaB [Thalassocella blandensis]